MAVSQHFSAGLQLAGSGLWIGEEIDSLGFGGPIIDLTWWF